VQAQHGFSKGKSTITNILETLHEWSLALDKGVEHDVIYLDIAKAFDTVPHAKLLYKLERIGLPTCVVQWVRAFLTERIQSVVVNNVESDVVPVSSGVPQGSVLGPILFLIYINDLPKCVIHGSAQIFADDTKIYISVSAQNWQNLQEDLNRVSQWCHLWQLSLSASKCLAFKVKRGPIVNDAVPPSFMYKLGDRCCHMPIAFVTLESIFHVLSVSASTLPKLLFLPIVWPTLFIAVFR